MLEAGIKKCKAIDFGFIEFKKNVKSGNSCKFLSEVYVQVHEELGDVRDQVTSPGRTW